MMGGVVYPWGTVGTAGWEAPCLCGMGSVENSVSTDLWDQEQAGACTLCMAGAWP